MADIIQLLPENIANQIAAGEVIQRPASVIKELVENSIDALASEITIIIKDAGKTLIQVIDNGIGMSDLDARMCFERHATSKIKIADDLFNITTKGFRGEALASIAAIAHVELITKKEQNELGTRILIHGSKIEKQEYIQAATGTKFSVKNLFYNIPARRKFLKSDPVELRHLLEEIHRIALAHPDVVFKVFHNNNEVYHLTAGTLKQRIIGIFGKQFNEKLLPISEETDTIKIEGFVLKADAAKKNAGEQYFFVNNRFIKSAYLNHAVKMGFDQLIQQDHFPGYFIYLEVNPATIDINVHPTKTEIKFDEEKLIYNYIRVSVKHALGKYLIAPTLDFDTDTNYFNSLQGGNKTEDTLPSSINYKKNLSETEKLEKENLNSWDEIYKAISPSKDKNEETIESDIKIDGIFQKSNTTMFIREPYQVHNSYILSHVKNGFMLIDQQYAHERILYEENLRSLQGNNRAVQRELFAQTAEYDGARSAIINSILPKLNALGFEIGEFGKNTFVIHGIPAGMDSGTNSIELLNDIIDNYNENMEFQLGIDLNIARSFAQAAALKRGKQISVEDMRKIIDQLFACESPFTSPSGHKTFIQYTMDEIKKQFK
ncbi:MAG: mismatch repair endonuclease MutL [Bacteroidota bacterium]|jgi:DNA mismatch repair protein MutL